MKISFQKNKKNKLKISFQKNKKNKLKISFRQRNKDIHEHSNNKNKYTVNSVFKIEL